MMIGSSACRRTLQCHLQVALVLCIWLVTGNLTRAQDDIRWHVQPTWTSLSGGQLHQRVVRPAEQIPSQDDQGRVTLEAETAAQVLPQRPGQSTVLTVEGASEGKALGHVKQASLSFALDRDGAYRVWCRLRVPSSNSWNFEVSVGSMPGRDIVVDSTLPANQWEWRSAGPIQLTAGIHQLKIATVFNGQVIDQIALLPADMDAPPATLILPKSPLKTFDSATIVGHLNDGWIEGMRWRAGATARDLGLHWQIGANPWKPCDDRWRDQPARFRWNIASQPVRLDQARVEVSLPRSAVVVWRAGAGDVVFHPPSGRVLAIRGEHVSSSLLSSPNLFSLVWYPPEAVGDLPAQANLSSAEQWRFLGGDGQSQPLIYEHQPTQVRLEIRVEAGPQLKLHLVATNPGRQQVTAIGFPRLPAVLTTDPKTSVMLWPDAYPLLVSQPETSSELVMPYPRAAFNCIVLGDERQNLYLATLDPQMRMNEHRAKPAPLDGGVQLSMTLLDRLGPGQRQQRTVVLSVNPGNWRSSIAEYGRWVESTFGPTRPPAWTRQSLGWYALGTQHVQPIAFWGQRDLDVDMPWFLGIDQVQLWGHGPIFTACPNYYYPDPGRGGPEGFTRYITTLREQGFRVGSYFHPHAYNPIFAVAQRFRGQEVQSLPQELRPPDFDWFHRHYRRNHPGDAPRKPEADWVRIMEQQGGGAETNGKVPRLFEDMDWSDPWQKYVEAWIQRYLRDYQIQTPYLDVWGFRPKYQSFNEKTVGFGDGAQAVQMQSFLDRLHHMGQQFAGDQFGFFYEGYTDVWSQRGVALLSHSAPQSIEVLKVAFPRQVSIIGGSNGHWRPVPHLVSQLGRAFVDGQMMDVILPAPQIAELLWMREALRPWYQATKYQISDGVLEAKADWLVRQHAHDSPKPEYVMWCWFDPSGLGGTIKLNPPWADRSTTRWRVMSSRGQTAFHQSAAGPTELRVPPGRCGVVFAVKEGSRLPQSHVTLWRALPQVNGFDHEFTALNLDSRPIEVRVRMAEFGGSAGGSSNHEWRLRAVAGASATQTVREVAGHHRRKVIAWVGDENLERRRIDGAAAIDPQHDRRRHRPFVADHPNQPGRRVLCLDTAVTDDQLIFWPPNTQGVLHLRVNREGNAPLRVRVEPDAGEPSFATTVRTGSDWQEVRLPFRSGDEDSWMELKLRNADPTRGRIWIESIRVEPVPPVVESVPPSPKATDASSAPTNSRPHSSNIPWGVSPP